MSDIWIEVYLPVKSDHITCKDCHDCANACPVKAITPNIGGVIVDRLKCVQYVLKEEECFECLMACKSKALSLRVFLFNGINIVKQK